MIILSLPYYLLPPPMKGTFCMTTSRTNQTSDAVLAAPWTSPGFLTLEKWSLPMPCEVNTPPFRIENSSRCCVNNRISSSGNQRRSIGWSSCFCALTFAFFGRLKGEELREKKSIQSIWLKSALYKIVIISENKDGKFHDKFSNSLSSSTDELVYM